MSIFAVGFWCLVVASVVALTAVKTRAARQRKEMLAELAGDGAERGPGPTATAFLDAGAPPPVAPGDADDEPAEPPQAAEPLAPDQSDAAGGAAPRALPDQIGEPLPSAGPVPAGDEPLDRLAALFSGVCLPCELTPLTMSSTLSPDHATFVTVGHTTDEIRQSLEQQFRECGLEEIWHDDLRATLRRGGDAALVTIHPFPGQAHDEDERPRFPTAPDESVVVEFAAL